jgi:putative peptidoglycan lipid II flippase
VKSVPSSTAGEYRRISRAAGVVGAATLLSRVLGYLRDVVVASLFGAGMTSDVFIAAFRIPNLLRRLFGEGSLSIAFVPVFTHYLTRQGRSEAVRLAGAALRLVALVLALTAVAGILAGPLIIRIIAPGFTAIPHKSELAVLLTRIMFPYIFFIGLVALCMGILNCLGHFAAPALAPVLLNLAMIASVGVACLVTQSETLRVVALSAGVLLGGLLQLALQLPFLIKKGINPLNAKAWFHPGLKRVGRLMGPTLLGTAVYQINILVGTLLASLLPQGSVSYLYFADRLVQFPLGVFGIALATAVLPSLSRQAAAGEMDALSATFAHALKMVFFITLPAMLGLIVLRHPIVALLFQRGQFDAHASRLTASALLYYATGLWAFAAVRIVVASFYALEDARTPVIIAIVAISVNIVLGILLMKPMRHNGLALATSVASILNLGLLLWALDRRLGRLGGREIAFSAAKSLFCAAIMGISVRLLAGWLLPSGTVSTAHLVVGITCCIGLGIAIFTITAHWFRLTELQTVRQLVQERITRYRACRPR